MTYEVHERNAVLITEGMYTGRKAYVVRKHPKGVWLRIIMSNGKLSPKYYYDWDEYTSYNEQAKKLNHHSTPSAKYEGGRFAVTTCGITHVTKTEFVAKLYAKDTDKNTWKGIWRIKEIK